jgi:hypothetical protein
MSTHTVDANGVVVVDDSDSDSDPVASLEEVLGPLSAEERARVRRRLASRKSKPSNDVTGELCAEIISAREQAGIVADGPAAAAGRRYKRGRDAPADTLGGRLGGSGGGPSSSAAAPSAAASADGPPPSKRGRPAPAGSNVGGSAASSSSSSSSSAATAAAALPSPWLHVDTGAVDAASDSGEGLSPGAAGASSSAAAAAPAPAVALAAAAAAAAPSVAASAAASPLARRTVGGVYSARAAAYVDPRDRILRRHVRVRAILRQLRALRPPSPAAAAAAAASTASAFADAAAAGSPGSGGAASLLDTSSSAGMLRMHDLYPQPQQQQQQQLRPAAGSAAVSAESASASSSSSSSSSSSFSSPGGRRRARKRAPVRLATTAGAGAGGGGGAPGELSLFTRERALTVTAARRQLRAQLAVLTGPALLAATAALRPPPSNPLLTCGRRDYIMATTRPEHAAVLVDPAAVAAAERGGDDCGNDAPPLQLSAEVAAAWAADARGAPEMCAWRIDLFTWAGRRRRHHPPPAVCAAEYAYRPPPRRQPPPPRWRHQQQQQHKGGGRGAGAGSSSPIAADASDGDFAIDLGGPVPPALYYHSRSGELIKPWEADVDSEDEAADELATTTVLANLDVLAATHAAARADDLALQRAWGVFVTAQRPLRTIADLPTALLQFVQARWRLVVTLPPGVWATFVGGVFAHATADALTLVRCAHMLEEAWWRRERERRGDGPAVVGAAGPWTGGAPRALPPAAAAAASSSSSSSAAAAPAPPQLPPPGTGVRWQDWLPPDLLAFVERVVTQTRHRRLQQQHDGDWGRGRG